METVEPANRVRLNRWGMTRFWASIICVIGALSLYDPWPTNLYESDGVVIANYPISLAFFYGGLWTWALIEFLVIPAEQSARFGKYFGKLAVAVLALVPFSLIENLSSQMIVTDEHFERRSWIIYGIFGSDTFQFDELSAINCTIGRKDKQVLRLSFHDKWWKRDIQRTDLMDAILPALMQRAQQHGIPTSRRWDGQDW